MSVSNVSDFVISGKKILGVANNYMTKREKEELAIPKKPIIYHKPVSTYVQDNGCGKIILPKNLTVIVPHVHLGVIINRKCKQVCSDEAVDYIGGYCIAIDLTAECFLKQQRKSGNPWLISSSFDTSTAVSKFIPIHKIRNMHGVRLWLNVNGLRRQWGNTQNLVFKIHEIIASISQFMTLVPNDLVLTGTPCSTDPIASGDIIECGLDNIAKMTFSVQ